MAQSVNEIMSAGINPGFSATVTMRSPDEVVSRLVELGASIGEAMGLARSYYASFNSIKSAASSAASSVESLVAASGSSVRSSGSWRAPFRKLKAKSWRSGLGAATPGLNAPLAGGGTPMVGLRSAVALDDVSAVVAAPVLAEEFGSGFCYLKAVMPGRRAEVAGELGSDPSLLALARLPADWFIACDDLRQLYVSVEGRVGHLVDWYIYKGYRFTTMVTACESVVDPLSLAVSLRTRFGPVAQQDRVRLEAMGYDRLRIGSDRVFASDGAVARVAVLTSPSNRSGFFDAAIGDVYSPRISCIEKIGDCELVLGGEAVVVDRHRRSCGIRVPRVGVRAKFSGLLSDEQLASCYDQIGVDKLVSDVSFDWLNYGLSRVAMDALGLSGTDCRALMLARTSRGYQLSSYGRVDVCRGQEFTHVVYWNDFFDDVDTGQFEKGFSELSEMPLEKLASSMLMTGSD